MINNRLGLDFYLLIILGLILHVWKVAKPIAASISNFICQAF